MSTSWVGWLIGWLVDCRLVRSMEVGRGGSGYTGKEGGTYNTDLNLYPPTQRPDLQQHILQQRRTQIQRRPHFPSCNHLGRAQLTTATPAPTMLIHDPMMLLQKRNPTDLKLNRVDEKHEIGITDMQALDARRQFRRRNGQGLVVVVCCDAGSGLLLAGHGVEFAALVL